jgi:redox-sensitive bicupin YhaK (pirin superfamily)
MITVIPSADRYYADHGWLQTNWHFSFGDYYAPKNMNWSALRVFNDDVILGGGGFPLHPHKDMEIITYVVSGELEHQDKLGNRGVVQPGEVQVMSAGRGITHAEFNASATNPVHLMQLWVMPKHQNNQPRWEQRKFSPEQRAGKLLPVVSGGDVAETLTIDQDAAVYVSAIKAGQQVSHENRGTHAYLFVIDGSLTVNGKPLGKGDQARIAGEKKVDIRAEGNAELILLDLP